MKKIFVILFLTLPLGLFAQGYTVLTDDTTDIRNNVWFWSTNYLNVDEFLVRFNTTFVKERITDRTSTLPEPHWTICQNLLNRGRNIALPNAVNRVMIICDDTYGVLIWWWNDTSTFGGSTPGERVMLRYFFRLK